MLFLSLTADSANNFSSIPCSAATSIKPRRVRTSESTQASPALSERQADRFSAVPVRSEFWSRNTPTSALEHCRQNTSHRYRVL